MCESSTEELKAFVARVRLEGLDCTECSARSSLSSVGLVDGQIDPLSVAGSPRFELGIETPDEGEPTGWFAVKVRVAVEFSRGSAAVEWRAVYRHDGAEPPAIELLTAFTNEVALMALIPYLRQSLADVTARVFGMPLTMPMFARGDISFRVPRQQKPSESD